MVLTNTKIFTHRQNQIAIFVKVFFGHTAVVAILQNLFKIDSCFCMDMVDEIGLAQPTISRHLKELKYLRLIKGSMEGTWVCYCIVKDNLTAMKELLSDVLDHDLLVNGDCY